MTDGVVNVLKPPGMTSSNVVSDLRRIFGLQRVGHTGTLDPGAAGVLPVCIGRATRLFDFLADKDKEYIAELCLGAATDTQDSYGAATDTAQAEVCVREEDLRAALAQFTGTITQTVPMYSAARVGGKRLYELARAGVQSVVPKIREVEISGLELLGQTAQNRFLLRVCCSRGTYVRTLCFDIGQRLGYPAHMSFLLRTRSGAFRIEDAYSIAELEALKAQNQLERVLVAPDVAVENLPKIVLENLDAQEKKRFLSGTEIEFDGQGPVRVYVDGAFVGLGQANAGRMHISVRFTKEEETC